MDHDIWQLLITDAPGAITSLTDNRPGGSGEIRISNNPASYLNGNSRIWATLTSNPEFPQWDPIKGLLVDVPNTASADETYEFLQALRELHTAHFGN